MKKIILKTVAAIVGIVVISLFIMSIWGITIFPVGKPITPQYTEKEGLEIGSLIVETGCVDLYDQLYFAPINRFPYAFVMANKYNTALGCYDMHECILSFFEDHHIEIDSISENIAFNYLKKGAKLGGEGCIQELVIIYENGGKFIRPDSTKAKYYKDMLTELRSTKENIE
ncbi:MAG: hypothetical protein J6Y37_00130 [Paludibacteraceae bacterium]|nr:hypothetical protein [Paludibacteraceae bacterium]